MSRYTVRPINKSWENIPFEEIKKMAQLQKDWEKKIPFSLLETSCKINELHRSVNNNNDNSDNNCNGPNTLTVDMIIKKTACVLTAATYILTHTDIYNDSKQKEKFSDIPCKVNHLPFESYSMSY